MHNEEGKTKVGVVGGSGYSGLELVRLLHKHPSAQLRVCFSTNPAFSFSDYLPFRAAQGIPVVDAAKIGSWLHELTTVFLATPAEVSLELAPKILDAGVNVIDLSGAFRLADVKDYAEWYQLQHPRPDLLKKAQYGLQPWLANSTSTVDKDDDSAKLIANPGCYATSVLMALLPLLKRDLVVPESIVIDSKSGTSGAGRKPAENLLFTEVEGECLPYRLGKHQHLPEICQFAAKFGGTEISPFFTTHLLGIRRGIISGLYMKLRPAVTALDITAAYAHDYSDYGLVDWSPLNELTSRSVAYRLSLKRVVGTALTRIHYHLDGDRLYLFSLIDNLGKGAAGQAIENFNRLQRLPLGTGIKDLEGVL